jgi:ABC-type Fe3+/spermidine/putrescine transport system ATPase subunit
VLDVISIYKTFDGVPVLRDVSFHAGEGEIICLLGPSGCGKTTMLRLVAGLETADAGAITLDGQSLAEVPVHRRGFGLMFQDFALFPHKDMAANVAFGLRMRGLPAGQVQARVAEMLDLVGLTGYERRRVYDLSGGEQQRVALARSLAPGPRLLMLDEPLGSLDRALREELLNELRAILKRVGVTTLYVTHDQQEAFAVADRVLIMNRGQIVQHGTPQQVYRRPASPWVARFLGLTNLLPGHVTAAESGQATVAMALGRLALAAESPVAAGQTVTVLIRPEAARLAGECPTGDGLVIEGTVSETSFRGGHVRLLVRPGVAPDRDLAFEMVVGTADLPGPGEAIRLVLQPEAISLLATSEKSDGQAAGH